MNNSLLSGYAYIDRNNDGSLAFSDQASPELVLPGVQIQLYQLTATTATLVGTKTTDGIGRYEFTGLAAGLYALRQLQPVQYVDGLDTVGVIRTLAGVLSPAGTSPGTASAPNDIVGITLLAGTRGDLFNFGERGLAPAYVSKRYLLGTAPPPVFATPPVLPAVTVPEPASCTLSVAALALLVRVRRARRLVRSSSAL